jgi:glycine/D-amino acid oxidase-like deaminating enzyme/nitrite reductase/ring-hydroxylating ferredoxin subunit
MKSDLGALGSLWIDTVERPSLPALRRDMRADVAVLGGGITGLSTALALAEEGAKVIVLEGRRIGGGATGFTTAKLSSLHGLTYDRLLDRHGDELARMYGEANEAGIAAIAETAERLGIDCELGRKPNYTYAESPGDVDKVEAEVEAARRLGLPASLADGVDLPYPVAAAIRFEDQAQFHPVRYLAGLADALEAAGVRVFERTFAVSVSEGSPCRVDTDRARTVSADQVVVATHIPFLDRGLFFARTHPERSYVVAAEVDAADAPSGMYLSTESPAHSIRAHRLGDGRSFLLVGGESHKTGQSDAVERFERLAGWAREHFGVAGFQYHWATQDNMPADGVPYIGRLHPLTSRVFVATGFKKWGLALGAAAARLITDLIQDRGNPWTELFDPSRLRLRAALPSFLKENANVGMHFFSDRLLLRGSADGLAPGEGRVVSAGHAQRAVYRDDQGEVHALSARCTHLGCIVAWNAAERTWDCRCHGSRFAAGGDVIQGPAVHPLPREELD